MNLEDVAKVLGVEIRLRYPDIDGNWMCNFDDADEKSGCMLISITGRGRLPMDAMIDYWRQIQGKVLCFHATSKEFRREIFISPNPPK